MKLRLKILTAAFGAIVFISCNKQGADLNPTVNPEQSLAAKAKEPKPEVYKAWGSAEDVTAGLNIFREALGNPLNSAPGAVGGRREINWDGVPAALTNNDNFPTNFFAQVDPALPNGRKRGIQFISLFGFRTSDNDFADIDPSYADEFDAFSVSKTFMPVSSNTMEVVFKVPGTNLAGYVEGFGVVFSDVEGGNSALLEFFDDHGESLGVFMAHPQTGNGKLSFLGVKFQGKKITKVKITSGNGILEPGVKDISAGGMYDLVVMDDYLYNEPKALD